MHVMQGRFSVRFMINKNPCNYTYRKRDKEVKDFCDVLGSDLLPFVRTIRNQFLKGGYIMSILSWIDIIEIIKFRGIRKLKVSEFSNINLILKRRFQRRIFYVRKTFVKNIKRLHLYRLLIRYIE